MCLNFITHVCRMVGQGLHEMWSNPCLTIQPCGQCRLKVGYQSNLKFPHPPTRIPPAGWRGGVLERLSYNPGVGFYDKCLRPYVECCGVTNLGFVPQLFTQCYLVSLLSLLGLGMRIYLTTFGARYKNRVYVWCWLVASYCLIASRSEYRQDGLCDWGQSESLKKWHFWVLGLGVHVLLLETRASTAASGHRFCF